jgi:hypothetical protein
MTMIDRATEPLARLIGEPSFADAIVSIETADDLSPVQKRHWQTSLRCMGRYLDRALTLIPTRIAAIGQEARRTR